MPRALLAEVVGTFAFFTLGAGSVIVSTAPDLGAPLGSLGVAVANGVALAVLASVFLPVSGAHFNPAVTVSVWVGGKIDTLRAGAYVAAQLLGALSAGLVLRAMFARVDWEPSNLGTPGIGAGVSIGRAILVEAVLTFVLALAVWGTALDARGARMGGVGIGLAVLSGTLVGAPLTGAAMNPARHLGPAIAAGSLGEWWVYWVGPLAGAAVGALVYRAFFWREGVSNGRSEAILVERASAP